MVRKVLLTVRHIKNKDLTDLLDPLSLSAVKWPPSVVIILVTALQNLVIEYHRPYQELFMLYIGLISPYLEYCRHIWGCSSSAGS